MKCSVTEAGPDNLNSDIFSQSFLLKELNFHLTCKAACFSRFFLSHVASTCGSNSLFPLQLKALLCSHLSGTCSVFVLLQLYFQQTQAGWF